MSNVYEALGVPTVINAVGPSTRLSGGIMHPEVAEAMAAASQHCVDIAQLQRARQSGDCEVHGRRGRLCNERSGGGLTLGARRPASRGWTRVR